MLAFTEDTESPGPISVSPQMLGTPAPEIPTLDSVGTHICTQACMSTQTHTQENIHFYGLCNTVTKHFACKHYPTL